MMKRYALLIPLVLAGCGGVRTVETRTTTAVASTTTSPVVTHAPTTTIDYEEEFQVNTIESMFPAERRVEICLMQLRLHDGGLPKSMIVDLGVESFVEGFGPLKPRAEKTLRTILEECLL